VLSENLTNQFKLNYLLSFLKSSSSSSIFLNYFMLDII
jgi:hypothetical protein